MSGKKFVLKVRTKAGENLLVDHLNSSSTVQELKLYISSQVSVPADRIILLNGYPPRPVSSSDVNLPLTEVGIKSGDSICIEISPAPMVDILPAAKRHIAAEEIQEGVLMRQVVPADNSCLFTSIGFVLGGKVDTTCSTYMRQVIAEQVASNEDIYSDGILGKKNKDYCKWILKPESWGGAIELAVLSHFYGIEIAVVDTMNAVINKFGEDKNYEHRVFLIFDGIHYDPLYKETLEGVEPRIQTMFLRSNEKALKDAEELAHEAKSSRQYTDVDNFTLHCLVCHKQLQGQTQAQIHAKESGHNSFGETAS